MIHGKNKGTILSFVTYFMTFVDGSKWMNILTVLFKTITNSNAKKIVV